MHKHEQQSLSSVHAQMLQARQRVVDVQNERDMLHKVCVCVCEREREREREKECV
jgi:hypothetical protein